MNIDKLLDGHQAIGWDVDGTILDHLRAGVMHDYIRRHPEKDHYIVTFRSHGWQHETFDELADRHRNFPTRYFKGLLNIPDDVFAAYWKGVRAREIDLDAEQAYVEWKGLICSQHGITVLVDDNPAHVLPGCDRYGVLHVHPDDF